MSDTIPFEKAAVKKYLDERIRYWRSQVKIDPDFAGYYVDAYQSMRNSLFGEYLTQDPYLPKEKR